MKKMPLLDPSREGATDGMSEAAFQGEHGRDCPKAQHVGEGYLHAADDDRPYDVDGVRYCGRCHYWLGAVVGLPPVRVQGFDRLFRKISEALGGSR